MVALNAWRFPGVTAGGNRGTSRSYGSSPHSGSGTVVLRVTVVVSRSDARSPSTSKDIDSSGGGGSNG